MTKRSPKQAARRAEDAALTLTVHVPLAIRKRGHRKVIVTPQGVPARPRPVVAIDSALVRAIARAHRWKRMLEGGEFASVTELAAAEKANDSYVCRILRLTLLAPEIVEAVLNGTGQAPQIAEVSRPFPIQWKTQNHHFKVLDDPRS